MLRVDVRLALQKEGVPQFALEAAVEADLESNIVGIFGPSGCGKSSLLRCISGALNSELVEQSSVVMNNKELRELKPHQRDVALVGQKDPLYPHLSVEQNLDFVIKHGKFANACPFTKREVVAWCGIEHLLTQSVVHLSGGETQRLLFARGLLSGKSLLLLDEAFSALDWNARQDMLMLVVTLHQRYGIRFLMVSHSLKELALVCDRIWQMKTGRLVAEGPSQDMIRSLAMNKSTPTLSQLQVQFVAQDDTYGVCRWRLSSGAQAFELYSHLHRYQAEQSHLVVEANKVVLSTTEPTNSSMLNQVSGVVVAIDAKTEQVLVTLNVAEQCLIAEISKLSYERLGLTIGQQIFAQFKLV